MGNGRVGGGASWRGRRQNSGENGSRWGGGGRSLGPEPGRGGGGGQKHEKASGGRRVVGCGGLDRGGGFVVHVNNSN